MKKYFRKIDKHDKILAAYLVILGIFLFSTFQFNSLIADEGTHLLLSVFYKDLIANMLQKSDFSFQHAYQYGINYLVHYPKLQIAYPPLYHLTTAFVFSLFDMSEIIGRLVNLLYALGSFLLFYLIIKKLFSAKTALLATFLFSFSPLSLFFASRVTQDFTMFFFLLLSVYIFSFAIQYASKLNKRSVLLFALTGFIAFLAAMGKQMAGFVVIFFLSILAYQFIKTKNKKTITINTAVLLFAFLISLFPYLFVLNAVGGFEINKLVAIGYASQQGEPTSYLDASFWSYYIIKPLIYEQGQKEPNLPFMPFMLLLFLFYVYQRKSYYKHLAIWFVIFFIILTLIPNKEPRFSQIFLLPVFLTTAFYLINFKSKNFILSNRLLIIFIITYASISLSLIYNSFWYYPSKEISEQIFFSIPQNANIAMFSDDDPLYSSVIMWHIRTLDKNISTRIYRVCAFDNKSKEQTLEILKENNVYYILFSNWTKHQEINKIKDNIDFYDSIEMNNQITEIYKVRNFTSQEQKEKCNYICLTGEKKCS